jgi:asparagine synthase (glutamine-hydrolysing)
MCGFAAMVAINGGKAEAVVVEKMTNALVHRGPDGAGAYADGPVAFGFRRLSILDLSHAGDQPMISADGQTVIVFNGEIYNYIELRQELMARGHVFHSTGDTEVLLTAYREWGKDCVEKLNGMWAFLIYDLRRGIIFGSRDRFGVKPLYRYRHKGFWLFGSEIKAILLSGYYTNEINWRVTSRFLLQQLLEVDTETFYEDIHQVPAGCAFELELNGRQREWHYWSLDRLSSVAVTDPAESFYEVFEDAVRLRMRSDVPLGVCLSGGLDSTSIICAMARYQQDTGTPSALMAFSYMTPEFDESRYIQDTVRQTGAQLNRLTVNPLDLFKKLDEVLWYQDEPFHTMNVLIGYELVQLAAKNGIKVILNGQGADETIAGYGVYFAHYWYTLLAEGRILRLWDEIRAYCLVQGGEPGTEFKKVLGNFARTQLYRIPSLRRASAKRHRRRAINNHWFTRDFTSQLPEENLIPEQPLDKVLKYSVERALLPLYLRTEDRNSMAHGVEARLPFMDYRLVSLLFQLPAEWKMRGSWNKYVLREAMRNRIPESVRSRPDKMGFNFPLKTWVGTSLYEPLHDILSSQAVRERGIYDAPAIRRDLERHQRGDINVSSELFNVAQFEAWSKLLKPQTICG